jgi:hypothetical protein
MNNLDGNVYTHIYKYNSETHARPVSTPTISSLNAISNNNNLSY